MNILLTAHRFYPDVGGTETQAELMAEEFSKAGHKTIVVTQTIGGAMPFAGYELIRRPDIRRLLQLRSELLKLVAWAAVRWSLRSKTW